MEEANISGSEDRLRQWLVAGVMNERSSRDFGVLLKDLEFDVQCQHSRNGIPHDWVIDGLIANDVTWDKHRLFVVGPAYWLSGGLSEAGERKLNHFEFHAYLKDDRPQYLFRFDDDLFRSSRWKVSGFRDEYFQVLIERSRRGYLPIEDALSEASYGGLWA